jgi:16S rRNA processing protein RimM
LSSSTDRGGVVVGRIGRPHGLAGEVTVLPETDDARRFSPGAEMRTESGRSLVVRSSSPYRDRGLIVGFEGVTDRNQAEALRGAVLAVGLDTRRSLDAGEFWPDDLVGLTAVSPDGVMLGVIAAVELGVGQDRLVVSTPDGREVVVPFVAALVGDPIDGRIEIADPGGLFRH